MYEVIKWKVKKTQKEKKNNKVRNHVFVNTKDSLLKIFGAECIWSLPICILLHISPTTAISRQKITVFNCIYTCSTYSIDPRISLSHCAAGATETLPGSQSP